MKILVARQPESAILWPAYRSDAEKIRSLGVGEIVEMSVRRARSLPHHRKFWAQAALVTTQSDRWQSPEALVYATKISLGYVDRVQGFDGEVHDMPHSISFKAQDEAAFSKFHREALELWASFLGCSVDDLEMNCGEYL